ncbi:MULTISPECIES: quinone oxidoreductase [Methylobacterium]|uniref:Quinone oxidoreductase 1 n=1 Tax=Methylobacterium jeotgali TaxID=381630 RepID=A0ABQ4SY29_9HYPH|nr:MULTISPECIES: quinone oxidoreductase [Methylobacterium]PIU08480.1 MAG: quinone oxidoreductase [Methylobacterium sp. CG09_land_8_20_14_0_10_71_15]PIU15173.1 MAG: quinone oxidoreductase [Methylobacterium sp. CG08_land_8_20_14_0_20_71_15]GBU19167.1 quinone oxidoreductase [Methylobacterium sp.]GJE08114.1 Quinone oxidoreductase 1 [Methylobacterium jeotgali]
MPKAIRIREYGGPEVMTYEDVPLAEPGPGQIRVRQRAVGVNFIDIYFRSGAYKAASLPFTPGKEGAGEVTAVGEGVSGFKVGDRVAYGSGEGTYAEEPVIAAAAAVHVPEGIDDATAAAMMLKGLTAEYLLHRVYRVKAGDTILFHAAAGGVGLIACQWAKHLGARVIGTVGSQEKAEIARAHGCDHVILYREDDVARRVRELTDGKGVPVVYDGVGKATFLPSLDSLSPLGTFVSFGSASGAIEAFDIGLLAQKGSLYAIRPTLFTFTSNRATLDAMAENLLGAVASGAVKIPVHARYPLSEAQAVHRDLAGRQTTGATVMIP